MTMNSGEAAQAMKDGLWVRRPEWDNTLYAFRDEQSRMFMSVSASRGNVVTRELQSDDLFATDWYIVGPDEVAALRREITDAQALELGTAHPFDCTGQQAALYSEDGKAHAPYKKRDAGGGSPDEQMHRLMLLAETMN